MQVVLIGRLLFYICLEKWITMLEILIQGSVLIINNLCLFNPNDIKSIQSIIKIMQEQKRKVTIRLPISVKYIN